ncbi:uncharacterized protein K460DRAFT_38545 [Cucurbitaria berberidis CBS 394.84]|uniref:Uncharacterized protein n=1 Tax=Cucurbitaria berberidis CBS 394.84 TaxID=1168544 RepID=A0A9P4GTS8_9PLEO|nr:uncharacterized protein K460DRAFT_38545 [Cucurbitaria berberidis CBS 394.84]KAF1851610.1 hypothetical protein K460DRAFT_38545 [Cucurbitaria berberidis CBS 394.84]
MSSVDSSSPRGYSVSPSSRDKPLPSPPVVQVIDPNSPPKAQRTLVDAEAGTPSEDEWPILRPENISPPKKLTPQANSTSTNVLQQQQQHRSVSMGAAPQDIAECFFANQSLTPANILDSSNEPTASRLSTQGYQKSMQMAKPRTLSSNNPYANSYDPYENSYHAFSTGTESAMESPLAHKRGASGMVPVPPRNSSKGSSLRLSNQNKLDSPARPPSPESPLVNSGSTKWTVVGEPVSEQFVASTTCSSQDTQVAAATSAEVQPPNVQDLTHDVIRPADTHDTAQTLPGLVRSKSSWSLAGCSSLDDQPSHDYEGSTRIKRLSSRSSMSVPGPMLKIHGDADSILLGRGDPIPAMPPLPAKVPDKTPREQSKISLAERSKQTIFKISERMVSRPSNPNLSEDGTTAATPVRITPIRSMQPPRVVSAEIPSPAVSSPVSHTSIEHDEPSGLLPVVSLAASHTASGSSQNTIIRTSKPVAATVPTPDDLSSPSAIKPKVGVHWFS